MTNHNDWEGSNSSIAKFIEEKNAKCLASYKINSGLIEEHANIEIATAQGGYGKRQIYELIQNGADALLNQKSSHIEVVLNDEALYCANEGRLFDTVGVNSIMSSFVSMKRGEEIGRWGLGFKSVLAVTTCPQIFSRSGSFEFDSEKATARICDTVPGTRHFPILRIAFVLDPKEAKSRDNCLAELMNWAATVVKLPLNISGVDWLQENISKFPAEFLLFSPHASNLVLVDHISNKRRDISIKKDGDEVVLSDGKEQSIWQVFSFSYNPSALALKDAGEIAKRETVKLFWAVPKKGSSLKDTKAPGQFWAFFPTDTGMKLSGIVNAPWKTNEDRQNLLRGAFNYELIDKLASFIADNLELILDKDNPAGYIDILPGRRDEWMNWADDSLNGKVYEYMSQKPCIPDMNGILRNPSEVRLQPADITPDALQRWRQYVHHPVDWVHHEACTPNRRSRVERLMRINNIEVSNYTEWLETIAKDGTSEASLAAIATAAIILSNCSSSVKEHIKKQIQNAEILLDRDNNLVKPLPNTIFIPTSEIGSTEDICLVHSDLADSMEGKSSYRYFTCTFPGHFNNAKRYT